MSIHKCCKCGIPLSGGLNRAVTQTDFEFTKLQSQLSTSSRSIYLCSSCKLSLDLEYKFQDSKTYYDTKGLVQRFCD